MRTHLVSVVGLAFLILSVTADTAPAQGGGPQSPEQMGQNVSRMLTDVRANPQAKGRIVDRLRQRMTADGVADVETRLAEIGKILDEAAAMSGADFDKKRQDLVSRMASQIRGERPQDGAAGAKANPATLVPRIDVHNHFVGASRDIDGAVAAALAVMDQYGISRMIVMPPPQVPVSAQQSDCERFTAAIRPHGSRFAFLGGGGGLNVMIHQAAGQSSVNDGVRKQFEEKANALLQMGASGFGEMAVRHLSLQGVEHPYEDVRADHPLFLLLADIAARKNVPIDVHFDVVTNDIPTPNWLTSPNNPKVLSENLAGFERLLDHNPAAKICWEHLGSDNTGHWTVDLSRRLLTKHPNLYMALRLGPGLSRENYPLTPDGAIRPAWLQLFKDFPARLVIGDDEFFVSASSHGRGVGAQLGSKTPVSLSNARVLLNALPADLARKLGSENAAALFKLGS